MRSLNEKLERLMQEKQDADQFIRVIAPEYIAVYLINFAQDSFRKILIPDFFRDMLDKCNGSFRRAMLEYIRLYIAPEDQEEFESLTCAKIVRERLRGKAQLTNITSAATVCRFTCGLWRAMD